MADEVILTTPSQLKILLVEAVSIALKYHQTVTQATSDDEPYGDFNWLCTTCAGVPASTLRVKSAAGDIPGVVKFGKRVLYEKAIVLTWLKGQQRDSTNTTSINQDADEQINRRLIKNRQSVRKGGNHDDPLPNSRHDS